VQKLQWEYKLTPLSQWGREEAERPERHDMLEPIEPEQDPLGPFGRS